MNDKPRMSKIITFAGSIIGFVYGAGFASGQEIMQFFSSLGFAGSMIAGFTAMLIFAWYSAVIMEDSRKLQLTDSNKIFEFYCGKYLGKFFEWFIPFITFLVVSLMISGAGAAVAEHYGISSSVGRMGMAIITYATVLLGLNKLVEIIGKIGPVIILLTILMGIVAIVQNPQGILQADEIIKNIDIPRTSSIPLWSGILYAAFSITALVPFLAGMGKSANNRKEAIYGGMLGGILLMAGGIILNLGVLANISDVFDKEIPSLAVAGQIFPIIASIFVIMLLAGIYTTAVPMFWTAINRISTDHKSRKYKVTASIAIVLAYFGGQLKFSTLIGILYPFLGYVGLVIILCMIYTKYIKNIKTKESENAKKTQTM